MHAVAVIALVVTLLACCYVVAAIALLLRFARRPFPRARSPLPSMTVLKPMAGSEAGLYHALASWCEQEYPDYEIVYCVHSSDDEAAAIARRVMHDYPRCRTRLLTGDEPNVRNPKIANLLKSEQSLTGEIVVIADSDARVEPNFLRGLASSFDDPDIAAATCLYRAQPQEGFVSQLGAGYVDDQFAPSVLVATAIGPLRFCLGATMAVRRAVLEHVGGLRALGQYLADDHRLGELVAEAGYRIDLSRCVVGIAVGETTLSDLWSHELRWARTSMAQAPVGYAFSFLMFPLPLAVLHLLCAGFSTGAWIVLLAALGLRIALHYVAHVALGVRRAPAPWLAPVRDGLSFALWFVSLWGRRVRWRQAAVDVDRRGRITGAC